MAQLPARRSARNITLVMTRPVSSKTSTTAWGS